MGRNPAVDKAVDKAVHGIGFFGGKAEGVVSGVAQRVDGLATSRVKQYGDVRGTLYQPGDFTHQPFERSFVKQTTDKERELRRDALSGEKGVSNAEILKAELEELIHARKETQAKLIENQNSYPDREGRAKNRVAAASGVTILMESLNWLRDWMPGSQKDCEGNPQKAVELSTWWTVLQSAALCYGSYKFFYEPVQKNYENEQAKLNGWIEEYNQEIHAILDDLRQTGHSELVGQLEKEHDLATENHLIRSNSFN